METDMTIEPAHGNMGTATDARPRKGWLGAAFTGAFALFLLAAKAWAHVHGFYKLCQYFGFCS
jgi:hypothetical protein